MKYTVNDLVTKGVHTLKSFEKVPLTPKNFLLIAMVLAVIFSLFTALFFFAFIQEKEEVMVPNVIGKDLPNALLEMQVKELYPKVILQYSDVPQDKGTVLSQAPLGGTITKAGKRITLTISQGVILDRVENYVGQNINDVKLHIQTVFPDPAKALLTIDPPLYVFSTQAAGTIIEQDPEPESKITILTPLKFVISRGPESEKLTLPNLVGMTIENIYLQMAQKNLVIDFSTRPAQRNDAVGTIVSQLPESGVTIDRNSRVGAVVALPTVQENNLVYNVFMQTLPDYPYPLTIIAEAVGENGTREKLLSFKHPGGLFSFPYVLAVGTTLVFSAGEEEVARHIVE